MKKLKIFKEYLESLTGIEYKEAKISDIIATQIVMLDNLKEAIEELQNNK